MFNELTQVKKSTFVYLLRGFPSDFKATEINKQRPVWWEYSDECSDIKDKDIRETENS